LREGSPQKREEVIRAGWLLPLALLTGCPEVDPPAAPSTSTHSATTSQPTATASASATPSHAVGQRIDLVEKAMGTRVVLAAYTSAEHDASAVRAALRAGLTEIKRLELLMTSWRDDSEVSLINAQAGRSFVKVSDETYSVVAKSLWISKLSEGTFDVTFASMGKLWRFDQDLERKIPPKNEVERARKRIDYKRIELDSKNKAVKLSHAETRISLGGIAKGYAIDRAADVLRKAGLKAFFAQAGGDLYVEGRKPDGTQWKVGVRDPRASDETFFAMLPVENHAFSTAGDYERAFVLDGKRYHHIIDPRTGYPAGASRSVTVWAKDALTADAIDDAVFILGPTKGLALVESIDDCGAVIVDANNKVWISKRLEGVLQMTGKPTDGT
jgi:thiamine biosynthesis lipoprotein